MKHIHFILMLISLLVYPTTSFSAIYFGAAVGQSSSEDKTSASDLTWFNYTNVDSESLDTKDTAFSIFGGYDFKIYENDFAVEVGWVDFGKNSLSASGQDFLPGGTGRRTVDVISEAEAITLSLIGKKNIMKEMIVFGKLGVSAWDISEKIKGSVSDSSGNPTGSTSQSASDRGYDIFYGIGIGYSNFMIQFDRYKMGGSNTNYISLGFRI